MNTLIAAYLIGWLAVAGYLGRLAIQQRSLARRLDHIRLPVEETQTEYHFPLKAA